MTVSETIEPNSGIVHDLEFVDHVSGGAEMFGNGGAWTRAIDDYTDYLISFRGNGPGTVALRRCHLRALAATHLRRSPWRVSPDDLAAWMARQSWEPATYNSYRSTIRSFFEWARKTGRIKKNPAIDLTGNGRIRTIPRGIPEKMLTRALRQANDRDRLIIVLGAWSGLRRAEIAGLEWDNRHGQHLWVSGKGKHQRRVPCDGIVGTALDAEQARRHNGEMGTGFRYPYPDSRFVFPGRDGERPMSPESIGRAASAALPGDYSTHTLRHRFGTVSYAMSRDLRGVQKLLGHHSPSVTEIYTHLSDDALDAIVESIQPPETNGDQ